MRGREGIFYVMYGLCLGGESGGKGVGRLPLG